jgi:hypothetical protein
MTKVKRDEVRENRIADEIIVDAYGEDEQAMGWYNYQVKSRGLCEITFE